LPAGAINPNRIGISASHVFRSNAGSRTSSHLPEPVGFDHRQHVPALRIVKENEKPRALSRCGISLHACNAEPPVAGSHHVKLRGGHRDSATRAVGCLSIGLIAQDFLYGGDGCVDVQKFGYVVFV
jgi:hypothetical protein